MGANRRKNPDESGARVGCTANDLHFFGGSARAIWVGFDTAQAQPIGIWVLHSLDHPADAKRAQSIGGIFDAFHLMPEIGEGKKNVIQRG
jgi:hypothetical protein